MSLIFGTVTLLLEMYSKEMIQKTKKCTCIGVNYREKQFGSSSKCET